MSLGLRIVPSADLRPSSWELVSLVALEKWKTLDLLCSIMRPKSLKRKEMILQLLRRILFDFS